jgi:GTP pyrophosphokinase
MINKEKLKQNILEKSPKKYKDLINSAIDFAEKKHKGVKRLSGNEFIIHPLKTALILANQQSDTNTIIAGILTSSFEENDQNKKEIKELFGEEVFNLLLKVEEISKATGAKDTHYEIITKYILNSVKDLRPALVKLAGALHNVETIQYLPEDIQKTKIQKAINIYGKLAEYLYLEDVKKRIEEKAFELQNPIEYRVITDKYNEYGLDIELQKKYEKHIKKLTEKIDPNIKIEGRTKSKFSVYNKLKKYEKEWNNPNINELQDLLGFRIITDSEDKCYKILEVMMDNAELIYKDFEDYISFPKPNNYKAMQGPIIFKEFSDLQVEIQILTEEMHYTNTYGSASHIAYKASKSRFAKPNADYDWVEQIHNNFEEHKEKREIQKDIPIECNIFENEVFVFTPKGQIIDLDKGDTVLDYAFRIHSEVGHSAVAAKMNGKAIPLSYQPKTGDEIDIVTQKGKTCQNESSLHFANSSSTRAKILRGLQKKR